jgi:nucleotidyltransferase substrate binding protein (TIGR01987 family)
MAGKDIRWEQRFANFRKALGQLRKFVDKGDLSELEQQGLIKAFEYTFELAWNSLKNFLEYRGQSEIYGSRDAIRKAFELGLLEDGESWMDMLKSRNLTSYTYNQEVADEICSAVLQNYFPLFLSLETKLLALLGGSEVSDEE